MPTLKSTGLHEEIIARLNAIGIFTPLGFLDRKDSDLVDSLDLSLRIINDLKKSVASSYFSKGCSGDNRGDGWWATTTASEADWTLREVRVREGIHIQSDSVYNPGEIETYSDDEDDGGVLNLSKKSKPNPKSLFLGSCTAQDLLLSECLHQSPESFSSSNNSSRELKPNGISSGNTEIDSALCGDAQSPTDDCWKVVSSVVCTRALLTSIPTMRPTTHNGLQFGIVSEVVGSSDTGKTQLALSLAARAISASGPCNTVWYFTSSQHPALLTKRLLTIYDELKSTKSTTSKTQRQKDKMAALEKLKFTSLKSGHDLLFTLTALDAELGKTKLFDTTYHSSTSSSGGSGMMLVLDSAGELLKDCNSFDDGGRGFALLNECSLALRSLAREHHIALLVLNNSYTNVAEKKENVVALGRFWLGMADVRILLEADTNYNNNSIRSAESQSTEDSHSQSQESYDGGIGAGDGIGMLSNGWRKGHVLKHWCLSARDGKKAGAFKFKINDGGVV